MKLATFVIPGKDAQPGVLTADLKSVVPLGDVYSDMLALIDAGEDGLATARARLAAAVGAVSLEQVRLLAPIPVPQNLRDFHSDENHMKLAFNQRRNIIARMAGESDPAPVDPSTIEIPAIYRRQPVFYMANRFSVCGPEAEIPRPAYTKFFDYELELAAVIGKKGKNISEAQARTYIFGFTILNDFSARDRLFEELQNEFGPSKSKSFDNGTAIGPWIVTADEIANPYELRAVARVNGVARPETNGRYLLNSFEKMIAYVSESETLYPGEVIGTGTFSNGSGLEIDSYLNVGDMVELEFEGIGVLRNHIVASSI
ncbi:fumarylacetoacetate hydrolase family protein [Paraburkholderia panacisoli]|uniref:Fumarylacetoacetate hydrolase family protein n=1 Tax=Paraburkholderia panacisoli TaxID=2603818 RepID=A0A5B0G3R7_9BURK|nr:fumarylacetoacetate hydrolase family protein [Paraburkholderia panacisoli]KAA0998137.1 fumarylacetoacetate hydrolase family protein [Paraburkholderia panacisoli]